ncbi:spermatogenesis-associated protein 7 homolog isoform X2 [Dreissena polymorpha]|uniref:spermatogenesis-associated protein 7 homolog isoform X1 n=1 Tax=Dreissena polymorpha TaxID=45954 RepID=UPI002264BA14|nr:spermatogenesis-associated protein 7 homolog isoform X1 [Dreissena polymorpha]XP_052273058.1 spermatogenesis-associated protein 7 homolog isoform X2 [Dreissena polymorpha]
MGMKDEGMKSTTTMRGQLGVRSGPLAPTSAKLTTQYLVLDHMNNHYTKISRAKPAIDNRPPKSLSTSQKARDRKTREVMTKTGGRPSPMKAIHRSHTTTGYYQEDIYNENLWGEPDPDDEDDQLVHSIMRTTLRGNQALGQGQHNEVEQDPEGFNPYTRTTRQRPSSARSNRSMGSQVSRTMVQVAKKGTYDGDVLDKRSHVFTEGKPFTPRTLKTDRKSRLSQYKYYNKLPPKSNSTSAKQELEADQEEEQPVAPEEKIRPQPKPRQQRLDQTREGPVTMNSLMFETLHSRDFKREEPNPDIPKLDISMDTDHLKWVKEQALKAKHRRNSETLKSGTLREEGGLNESVDFGKTDEMTLTYGTLGSTKTRPPLGSARKISPEDEEAMYVRFMRDVTNEVLDRGIYTDRSLRQVFKAHIARNKGRLDELRLHQITDDIRQQLNIPRYDMDDDTSLSMTKTDNPLMNGTNLDLDKYTAGYGHLKKGRGETNVELEETGLNETSKTSKVSEDQSADTYNFKSTEDDDLYSTIQSDMNNTATLNDTQALKTYQMSINEQEELEESEIDDRHSVNDKRGDGLNGEGSVVNSHTGEVVDHHDYDDEEEEEEDDYVDDYEDEGDDEDEAQPTEPTATYRTDDDDDF